MTEVTDLRRVYTEGRRNTWELVRSLRDTGTTVLLTTPYLEEVEPPARRASPPP